MVLTWGLFALSAVAIVFAGTKLSQYGDRIAELTGLGRLWIGVLLMAAATSLPEVFTTMSAGLLHAPDLAAGDLFGAGLSNMLTLGVIDLAYRRRRVWQQAAFEHTLVASLAMVLTGLAAFLVLLRADVEHAGIGFGSVLLLVMYVLGMRMIFRQEDVKRRQREQEAVAEAAVLAEDRHGKRRKTLRWALAGFFISALALLGAAPLLAGSAKEIAEGTGVSATFIGTSLVAITTSMPELVTALAAVRLGAFDLAVGNLFGSNAFNMAAFFFADAAFREGPLLSAVDPAHALTALWSILLMNVGLMGIMYRVEKRYLLIEPDSMVMIVGYFLGLWLLFR
ncbi:MAG: sodium:calcium antiporter [Nitrospirota bacterium]